MSSFRDKQTTDMSSYNYNIDRRLMERNNFNQPSGENEQTQNQEYYQNLDKYGEITGEYLELPNIDKGMPMRSHIVPAINNIQSNDNPYLDFNLYREKPNIRVSSFDPLTHFNNGSHQQEMRFAKLNEQSQIHNQPKSTSIIEASNNFTFNFLDKFTGNLKSRKSIILSPFSIMQCFSLLYIGSKNQTEKLLKNYFNFPDKRAVHTDLYKINQDLTQTKVYSSVNLAGCPNYLTINDAYRSFINKIGHFIQFDPRNPQQDTQKINNIVSQATGNHINNFLQPQMLSNNILVLLNTVYFYSKWKQPFNPVRTKPEIFYGLSKTQVPMMAQTDTTHNYFEDTYNQILEMDYSDNVFSMGFILPKSQHAEPMINSEQFNYYVGSARPTKLKTIKIPKFKTDSRYSVSNLFKKYGLKDIFQNIDITEIIPPINSDPVFVTDIIHAAYIEVDEAGTKATAATGMFMQNFISEKKTPDINFIANHQFLYYIRHKPHNLVLFVGQYY